jgi:hypothetical protein
MKLTKIPEETLIPLLRDLSLLIGQAGIYGVSHNVTQIAARAAFPMLERVVGEHGAIEITLRDRTLLINGEVSNAGSSQARNLLERILKDAYRGPSTT